MKIKLYKYDEFPITYDTETKEKICIGKLTKSTLSTGYIIGIIRI